MSGDSVRRGFQFEFDGREIGRSLEFIAFVFPPGGAFVVGWPAAPGEARHDAVGNPVLLHFAPSRWLAPSPDAEITALVAAAEQSSAGTAVEVGGKWREYALSGADAARALACSVDSVALLDGRECAAVNLFDCPCVLARTGQGYAIWVQASFAADLAGAFARLRTVG